MFKHPENREVKPSTNWKCMPAFGTLTIICLLSKELLLCSMQNSYLQPSQHSGKHSAGPISRELLRHKKKRCLNTLSAAQLPTISNGNASAQTGDTWRLFLTLDALHLWWVHPTSNILPLKWVKYCIEKGVRFQLDTTSSGADRSRWILYSYKNILHQ